MSQSEDNLLIREIVGVRQLVDDLLTRESPVTGAAIPAPHATTHEHGGSDEIDVTGLLGTLADPQTPLLHAISHEDGGGDEMSVDGLSGLLADAQTPLAHNASHENGGTDEISAAGLSGRLADPQNADTLQGVAINATPPTTGKALVHDGTEYVPTDIATQAELNALASMTVTAVTASSPLSSSGGTTPNIAFSNQSANSVLAGPTTGAAASPAFRSLISADIPPINLASTSNGGITGILGPDHGGTGINNDTRTITINTNSAIFTFTTSGKTITFSNSLGFLGTDGKSLNLGGNLTVAADTVISGGGTLALAGLTFTIATNSGTLVFSAASKILTINQSLTLAGTSGKALTLTGGLTVGADTSITGGGTVALGGFTATIPEAMTTAGRDVANTFSTVQTFTGSAATAAVDVYVSAIAGTQEVLQRWRVDDDSVAQLRIRNGAATDGIYIPNIRGDGSGTNEALINVAAVETDSGTTPAMILDARTTAGASLTTRPAMRFRNAGVTMFELAATGALTSTVNDAATNTATSVLTLLHNSSGTPAANYGSAILFQLKSSTTVTQNAALITVLWSVATHASRSADILFSTVNNAGAAAERVRIPAPGGLVIGTAALATNVTDGFLYLPTCAGTPTGVPTVHTGTVAMIYDTTANKLWIYNGAWKTTTVFA